MLDAFQISLADRLRALPVSPEIQAQLIGQSSALANLKIPDGVGGETQAAIRQVVRESFVAGFRLVAYLAAELAAASALAAWLLIAGKARRESGKTFDDESAAIRQTDDSRAQVRRKRTKYESE